MWPGMSGSGLPVCKPGRGLVARGLPLGGELPLSWAELQAAVSYCYTGSGGFSLEWRSIGG